MALPLFQIGPFSFIRIDGPPVLPREESEIIRRPGVTGVGILRQGTRGKQFSVTSVGDVANWATAHTMNVVYGNIVNRGLVDMIYAGIVYSAAGIKFNVLDVKVTDIKRVGNPNGGIVAGGALVTAQWEMIAVAI